ncbi:DinB family protein [Pararhodonellum marinum]|uniref:DinB family protein n=1 Tax=Pararhodonellum marinum TaxID=2755358 RepID=UPI00188F6BD5|nr:DinB family protein [Pararhodonellum marinum]
MISLIPPDKLEYPPYFEKYISRVIDKSLEGFMLNQVEKVKSYFKGMDEEKALFPYGQGKWTPKEVLGHVVDTERIMAYRILCIARGEEQPLPGFDQDAYVNQAGFNQISLSKLLEDFEMSRYGLMSLLSTLPENASERIGIANGKPVSVRALVFIIAGHCEHHLDILRTRYS